MFKKALFVFMFAALFMATLPTFAQDSTPTLPDWSVIFYDQALGKLTRISPTGQPISETTLPISEGFDTYDYNVVVSPSTGAYAYLISQVGDGSSPVQSSKIIVYNPATQSITVSHDLDPAITREGINAAGTSLKFSLDGSRVLVGYYVPIDENTNTVEITALDTFTGEVINTLTSDNLADIGVDSKAAYFVQALSFQGDNAALILRPVFVAQNLQPLALNWNVVTNAVSPAPAGWVNAVDYRSQTAEALLLSYDPAADTLEAGEATPPPQAILPPNTLQLFNTLSGTSTTLYAQDANLLSSKFVQNGELILLFSDNGGHGTLLDRTGKVLKEFDNLPGDSLTFATPQGFAYVDPDSSGTLVAVNTQDGSYSATPFYTSEAPYTSVILQSAS